MNKIDKLEKEIDEYAPEDQDFIRSLRFADQEISAIKSMTNTEGWKVMQKKVREELQERIMQLVEEDQKVITLLSFLRVADTRTLSKTLEDELNKILPDDG